MLAPLAVNVMEAPAQTVVVVEFIEIVGDGNTFTEIVEVVEPQPFDVITV